MRCNETTTYRHETKKYWASKTFLMPSTFVFAGSKNDFDAQQFTDAPLSDNSIDKQQDTTKFKIDFFEFPPFPFMKMSLFQGKQLVMCNYSRNFAANLKC